METLVGKVNLEEGVPFS